jgi:hypothetical protein
MPGVDTNGTKEGDTRAQQTTTATTEEIQRDDFGLPIRKKVEVPVESGELDGLPKAEEEGNRGHADVKSSANGTEGAEPEPYQETEKGSSLEDAPAKVSSNTTPTHTPMSKETEPVPTQSDDVVKEDAQNNSHEPTPKTPGLEDKADQPAEHQPGPNHQTGSRLEEGHQRAKSSMNGISEWSHQQLTTKEAEKQAESEDEWQEMPAFAPYDIYDDDNRLVAREAHESDDEAAAYAGLGGAGKGYTRVQLDEDAQSATSMDENTSYLFKEAHGTSAADADDDEQRDAVSQMQATKDLLTETQRIAYVGMTRLALSDMVKQSETLAAVKGAKKEVRMAAEAMRMWSQMMMLRVYAHMDISSAEQIMIEQLAEHGVEPNDLRPTLMQNARVRNPMAEKQSTGTPLTSPRPGSMAEKQSFGTPLTSPRAGSMASLSSPRESVSSPRFAEQEPTSPPPYADHEGEDLPEVRTPSQLPTTKNIDIDLRWTVLCDLFLTLIADSVYDARSRVLLEIVGSHMEVPWLEICRFEKRVTDALEMQQAAEKENWNEEEHKENRRKMALKKRYMMMGLATVGGGLVIGLSAGLLAPVIGAGLAAGFTTIGVAGTGSFLAGAGGAAIITSSAAASGGIIAVRAANRRTGAVKTFEYRPLHNNKRVNLIVTVSGWMTGKVDDVRLPYSTVDPVMGDIYSVLWEPEMLTSMGDTINILATEVCALQPLFGTIY